MTATQSTLTLPPLTLVLGACGGAGGTTTALGIVNVTAAHGFPVVAVDTTPAGGDLADRGADDRLSKGNLEQLVATSAGGPIKDDVFEACSSRTKAGARVLQRVGEHTAGNADYGAVDLYLRARAVAGVYDIGHRLRPSYLAPLLTDPRAPIVLSVPCRADAFNRMRAALETIASTLGQAGLARTVVTVSNQDAAGWQVDVDLLREYLADQVWGIEQIPYDEHLASGVVLDHTALAPQTVAAYERLSAATAAIAVQ
ncbi:hypothetical protein [Rhodococcus sp. NPDC058521]|uniref:hypothetical protein n=1 Tax=Rhodococcus sp. NPDC058521 TaxID=3346536 RepID=UPI003661085B